MSEAPGVDIQPIIEKQTIPVVDKQHVAENLTNETGNDTFAEAYFKVVTPERTPELLSSMLMIGLEAQHDIYLHPERPLYNPLFRLMKPDQIPTLPTEPVARWAIDHIGDMAEVSELFVAMRIGFVALNEAFKSDKAIGLQKEILKNDTAKNLISKVVGVDTVNKAASGEPLHVSDETCFWISLLTSTTVPMAHSLGLVSFFGINDHMANPVPKMIFGQAVAAIVLAASHYAGKNHETIKDFASRVMLRVGDEARSIGGKFKEFDDKVNSLKSVVPANIDVNAGDVNKE